MMTVADCWNLFYRWQRRGNNAACLCSILPLKVANLSSTPVHLFYTFYWLAAEVWLHYLWSTLPDCFIPSYLNNPFSTIRSDNLPERFLFLLEYCQYRCCCCHEFKAEFEFYNLTSHVLNSLHSCNQCRLWLVVYAWLHLTESLA